MRPGGKEGEQRVARHRKMREKKQFETVECYTGLGDVTLAPDSIVLLECMSNLVANEIFEPEGAHDLAAKAVVSGVLRLKKQAKDLYVVTNEIFSDGILYDRETEHYMSVLGEANRRLAKIPGDGSGVRDPGYHKMRITDGIHRCGRRIVNSK